MTTMPGRTHSASGDRPLIVGDPRDSHVDAVLGAVEALGGPQPLILDAPTLARSPYTLDSTSLSVGDMSVRVDSGGRGWLRRYAPSMWGAGNVAGSLEAVRKRAFLTLVGSISRIGNRSWLTTLDAMLAAEDRLFQLDVVSARGYRTPRSLVASNGATARRQLGDRFIVKPLANGYYNSDSGPRAVFTSSLTEADLLHTDFSHAPFVAQEQIDTIEHLRVVTVGRQAWAAVLGAAGRPLDWRAQENAHREWEPVDATDVCAGALSVAEALNVGYSSQDWLRDSGSEPVFLDLNPGGQWLFLPDSVASPVTEAVATYLVGGQQ